MCICLTVVHSCFEWTYFGPLCLAVAGNVAQIVVYESGLPPFISGHSSSSSRNLSHGGSCQSIASFLKFPVLNILASCQPFALATELFQTDSKIRYVFWNASCQPFEFFHERFVLEWEDDWMITCNVDSMLLAINCGGDVPGRNYGPL